MSELVGGFCVQVIMGSETGWATYDDRTDGEADKDREVGQAGLLCCPAAQFAKDVSVGCKARANQRGW